MSRWPTHMASFAAQMSEVDGAEVLTDRQWVILAEVSRTRPDLTLAEVSEALLMLEEHLREP